MSETDKHRDIALLCQDFEDFFEHSHTGHIITDTKGFIIRCNSCISAWLDVPAKDLAGKRFSDLLSVGGKIYYETHLSPLLRIQGYFDEVALELVGENKRLKVTVNGYERRDENKKPLFIRLTILKATDRYIYEQNLRQERMNAENKLLAEKELALLREQFIAVLGHDLRNPLASVTMGAELLQHSIADEQLSHVAGTIKRSATRMSELISNVMDFARSRMGDGIGLRLEPANIVSVIDHVVTELQIAFPARTIIKEFNTKEPIVCDAARLSQLLSNLLANALTHGAKDEPVKVVVSLEEDFFRLSVVNKGTPISQDAIDRLFLPFTREGTRPSQRGLGLGLYIASEIARSHKGSLTVFSDDTATVFSFVMPV